MPSRPGTLAAYWPSLAPQRRDIVAGKVPGRTSDEQITLFRSNGIAIEDIVTAGRVYELARERGLGKQVAMWGEEIRASGARSV